MINPAWWVGDAYKTALYYAELNKKLAKKDQLIPAYAVSAGLGAGKTHGACEHHHLLVLQNQEAPYSGWMEPTHTLVKLAAIPTYKKVLIDEFGYKEGRDFEVYVSAPARIVYKRSGHEVIFISGDSPNNVVAFELSHASIDEAGACHADAQRNFRTRVRHPKAKILNNLIVGAPQGITAFAEEFDSDTLPDWEIEHWRKHKHIHKPFNRAILWTDDNPHIAGGYIQSLMDTYGHNPNLIKSYRYGLFCPLTEGVACPNYIPQKHDLPFDLDADPHRDIYLTYDFNANPVSWISLQLVPFDEEVRRLRYVALHESSVSLRNLDDSVVEFAFKHPVEKFHDTLIKVCGDMSGHADSHKVEWTDYGRIKDMLHQLGYKRVEIIAHRVNPLETDSVEALQRAFLEDYLYLNKSVKGISKSLMATTWKKGARKLDKPNGETHTHKFDALKYFAYSVINDFRGKRQPQTQLIW